MIVMRVKRKGRGAWAKFSLSGRGILYSTVTANRTAKSLKAVDWRSFDQMVGRVRKAFSDVAPDELKRLIDEVVANVRRENRHKRNQTSDDVRIIRYQRPAT
jgi:hypothetical protein